MGEAKMQMLAIQNGKSLVLGLFKDTVLFQSSGNKTIEK